MAQIIDIAQQSMMISGRMASVQSGAIAVGERSIGGAKDQFIRNNKHLQCC